MVEIDLIELFSGVGGFALGFEQAGFKIKNHLYSEIDKHAIANYKYNFKNAKYVGSITDFFPKRTKNTTIITFGSPCQDFSLAGKRKGLEGQRSSLIMEAIRIISTTKPDFFIWENVKGAFSSNNGADFWAILNAFTNIGGYRLEWQLLNTKWVLPQNRERIYLIGHLATSKRSFKQIFPFTKNDKLFTKSRQSKKTQFQTNNCATTVGTKNRSDSTFIVPKYASTLTAGGNSGGLHSDMTTIQVKSNTKKGFETAGPGDSINLKNLKSKTRRGTVGKNIVSVLDTSCNQAVIVVQRGRNGKQQLEARKDNCTNTITSVQKDNYLQFDISGKGHKSQQDRVYFEDGIMCTIPKDRTDSKINIITQNKIRRLTEIECERLQGFPDNWTKFGIYNGKIKEIASTNRYKLIGNAVTALVVNKIAKRLLTQI